MNPRITPRIAGPNLIFHNSISRAKNLDKVVPDITD